MCMTFGDDSSNSTHHFWVFALTGVARPYWMVLIGLAEMPHIKACPGPIVEILLYLSAEHGRMTIMTIPQWLHRPSNHHVFSACLAASVLLEGPRCDRTSWPWVFLFNTYINYINYICNWSYNMLQLSSTITGETPTTHWGIHSPPFLQGTIPGP